MTTNEQIAKRNSNRTNHIVTTNAQTGAVFLTYKGIEEVNNIIAETAAYSDPIYNFTAPDGVTHTVWMLPDEAHDIVEFEIGKSPNLYIADGHHRAASASRAQKVKMENKKERFKQKGQSILSGPNSMRELEASS